MDIFLLQDAYTPLLWTCENGHCEAAKVLLQNGADPNAHSVILGIFIWFKKKKQ